MPARRRTGSDNGQPTKLNDNHAFDARAVANLLLDTADAQGIALTNLALQKLLYFAHGMYLLSTGRSLVSGYFEAWTHGPVHPQVYASFKEAGRTPIQFRAMARDYATQSVVPLPAVGDAAVLKIARDVVSTLGKLPAARLVALSHAEDGPWKLVVDKARTNTGGGLRISDMLIAQRFSRHKLPMRRTSDFGDDPDEDTPLTR